MNEHGKEITVDSAKASLPIVGGTLLTWLRANDELVTLLSHLLGLISIGVGLAWYAWKFYQDFKKRSSKNREN